MTAPQGLTALGAFGAPWRTFRRTVVALSATEAALPASPMANRVGLWVFNPSSTVAYLGPTGVANSGSPITEFALRPQGERILPVTDQVTVYGIVASGTPSVVVWEWA